jgi:signal recognition particle subunit SRP54
MTKKERANPKTLNGSRRARIAKGAGVNVTDINRLVKQFNDAGKAMKNMQEMVGSKATKRSSKAGRRKRK